MAYRPGPFTLTRGSGGGENPIRFAPTTSADDPRNGPRVSFDPVDHEYEHVEPGSESEEEESDGESIGEIDDARELHDIGQQLAEALEEAETAVHALTTAMRRITTEHRVSAVNAAFGEGLGAAILDTLTEINKTFVKVYGKSD